MSVQYWLMKSEPEVFSIHDLAREKVTGWEGVRNYQARNFMRDDMRKGDWVLFYHSNAQPSGVAGLARVEGPAVADLTQFDRKSPYYDEKSTRENPRWLMVTVEFVEAFPKVVTLEELKKDKKLEGMALLQRGQRLSVQPLSKAHFVRVLQHAQSRVRLLG
jgi:predicted RNA-binding protein with PUA-like domain